MNPTKMILSFLGFGDVVSFLRASDAELLDEDTHALHCPDFHCQQQAARLRQKMEPSYIALCERFRCAKPVVKFRALMEDMTLEQIKAELDKTEAEVKE
jgi:hypothetical protein